MVSKPIHEIVAGENDPKAVKTNLAQFGRKRTSRLEGGQLGGLRVWGTELRKRTVAVASSIYQSPESGYWTRSSFSKRPQKVKSRRGAGSVKMAHGEVIFGHIMSTWTLRIRVRATCASSELCGLICVTGAMQKKQVSSSKIRLQTARLRSVDDRPFCHSLIRPAHLAPYRDIRYSRCLCELSGASNPRRIWRSARV